MNSMLYNLLEIFLNETLQAKCLKSGDLFEDPMFERNPTAAGHEVTWARPSDFCDDPKLVVDGMDRSGPNIF